jgi:hypothetical protein
MRASRALQPDKEVLALVVEYPRVHILASLRLHTVV